VRTGWRKEIAPTTSEPMRRIVAPMARNDSEVMAAHRDLV
jgi:hypothetical protein